MSSSKTSSKKSKICFLLKMGHSRPLFSLLSSFQHNWQLQMFDKSLPMTGFEPRISGVGGNRSTDWATTTAQEQNLLQRETTKTTTHLAQLFTFSRFLRSSENDKKIKINFLFEKTRFFSSTTTTIFNLRQLMHFRGIEYRWIFFLLNRKVTLFVGKK